MPLSKKRNRERMREARATCVQPKFEDVCPDIAKAAKYVKEHPFVEIVQPKDDYVELPLVSREDRWAVTFVQPIPNCPDGRYRDATE